MVERRCPRCHRLLEEHVTVADRERWWCEFCALVVPEESAVLVAVPRKRADLE